jgi:signal transduction histidine kinase
VVVNLGRNSYEAGAKEVRVSGRLADGRVVIDFADDGPGLPEKARERLFVPFAGSDKPGGTGLGLVIARDVMRAHRGDIKLVKTGSDGTAFRLELPAITEPGVD